MVKIFSFVCVRFCFIFSFSLQMPWYSLEVKTADGNRVKGGFFP